MVRATFVGSSTVDHYKTAQFDAIAGNKIAMSDETWSQIAAKGDDKLFADVVKVEQGFPAQRTVGA